MRCLAVLAVLVACGDDGADDFYDIGPDDDASDLDSGDDRVDTDDGDFDGDDSDGTVSNCTAIRTSQGECDPLVQEPCAEDQRCTWIWDSIEDPVTEAVEPNVGHLGCACAGPLPVGAACERSGPSIGADPVEPGTGAGTPDECERGTQCIGGICQAICDLTGGEPACGDAMVCVREPGTFISMGMVVAGTCAPQCDPLTQEDVATHAAACGSVDPAAPDRACYLGGYAANADRPFACVAIPRAAKGRTDGALADGPLSGGAYWNGCEAGYLPFWDDNTDDTLTVCAGICAPVPTDNTMPDDAAGDPTALAKLHDQPLPRAGDGLCIDGKKGHGARGDCRFITETIGVCFPYTEHTYDHDADPTTPEITTPTCAELPPAGGDPSTTIHNITADQAGCYGSEPLPLPFGRPAGGRALPHVLQ